MYSVVFSVMKSRAKVYSRFKIKKSENVIFSVLAIRYIIRSVTLMENFVTKRSKSFVVIIHLCKNK